MYADAGKQATFEKSLMRCAEALGDITPHVARAFYEAYPEGRERFEYHYPDASKPMEGEMVEQTLYCLMNWFSSPREIEIVVLSTFPHHVETLGIGAEQFTGFIEAVCRVIASTIPADAADELAVIEDLIRGFRDLAVKSSTLLRAPG